MKVCKRLLLLLALGCGLPPAHAEVSAADGRMVREVFARLLSAAAAPRDLPWPPTVEIIASDRINAQAGLRNEGSAWQTTVLCHEGLLKKVIQGNQDRMAYVLGHELAHHLLGHTKKPEAATDFLYAAFNREQELQADHEGMELALRAGFSYREGLTAMRRMMELGYDYPSFEMLSSDHPAWVDRIAELDHEQAELWRAMSAFENGIYFLGAQNYGMAERAFRQVTREFPGAYEAWVNLGYAQLMQYADALDVADLRRMGIGQLAASGFYRRPKSLEFQLRGVNEALWAEAARSLREALKLKPDLATAYADLGVAFLLKPSGKDVAQAVELLEKAIHLAPKQMTLVDDAAWLSSVVNLAAADAAMGNDQKAEQMIKGAEDALKDADVKALPEAAMIAGALQYNRAMLLARSSDAAQQRLAIAELEEYLRRTTPAMTWWELAYERYSALCALLGQRAKTQKDLETVAAQFRPVTGIETEHVRIELGQSMAEARSQLGRAASGGPVVAGTSLVQYDYPERGLRVMGMQQVLAITLRGEKAPAIPLREAVPGSSTFELRVGMPVALLDMAMSGTAYDLRPLVEPEVKYRFYSEAGVAVKMRQGRVSEMVIGRVPRLGK